MKLTVFIVTLLFFTSGLTLSQNAPESKVSIIETSSFKNVVDHIEKELKTTKAQDLLMVYDIDNTLLTHPQDLGSDQWYNWQIALLRSGERKPEMVATTFNEFYEIQQILGGLSRMRPCEPEIPQWVKAIQNKQIKNVVLTARGTSMRSFTERELERNNLDFSKNTIGPEGGYAARYYISNEFKQRVSFQNGLFFGSGQHKGKLLKHLLGKTKSHFKKIIFVDDSLKNVEHMAEAYRTDQSDPTQVVIFHYLNQRPRIEAFEKSDKSKVQQDWKKLKTVLDEVMVY